MLIIRTGADAPVFRYTQGLPLSCGKGSGRTAGGYGYIDTLCQELPRPHSRPPLLGKTGRKTGRERARFTLTLTLTLITNTYTLITSSLPKRRFQPWMRRSCPLRPIFQHNQTARHSCRSNLPHLFQH